MAISRTFRRLVWLVAALAPCMTGGARVWAQAAAPAAEAPPPGLWISGIHLSAQIDSGFMGNPAPRVGSLNFGHLFTDHANQVQLNQVLLTANKLLDPKNPGYQWGFKLQFMYGSDARYTQLLGELNSANPTDRDQFDIVEANVLAHVPWLTDGGIDFKLGQYPTPLGYETIDPSTNPFYSHSYIFQFGLPFKHTGGLATVHVNSLLDVYAGLDTGTNTSFGPRGDNNGAIGGIAGFGLNMMDGRLTVLALTHVGPEQPTRLLSPAGVNANGKFRYFNDVMVTYKATDALTLVTEVNLVRDDFGVAGKGANGFGIAQYGSYALSDAVALNARAEFWRDDHNFFVASFPPNNAYIAVQQGFPALVRAAPGSNTSYGALTLGVTWKPAVPAPVTGLLIRPEIRWDRALTGNHPFNGQHDNNAFTLGVDAVLSF